MEYKTEKEFLDNYDSSMFEKLSMTTDILVVSVSDEPQANYRKTSSKNMSILMIKRNTYPFMGKWCLPGGFLDIKEDLDDCPVRILEKETNLKNIYMEQLCTNGKIDRDPRMRIVSTSYMALVDKNKLGEISENASWFSVKVLEDNDYVNIYFDNGCDHFSIKVGKKLKEATSNLYDYEVIENDMIAFDHAKVIANGLNRLKNKIEYTDIVFNMMPEYFTLGELQQVYEVILNKKLLDPAFRRIIANKVKKTSKVKSGEGHRPSALFKYNKKK